MRMSDAEAVMWAVEKDPALRSDFCNLTILDRAPEETRLQQTLARALDAMPRLRQRVVSPPLRIAPPEFTEDPGLDLEYHVRRIAVPSPGDMRAVLDVCERLAEGSLDRSRPLWEFTLIDGLADGQAALLQKVHHTISDGVGALKLSLALLDFEPDPGPDRGADLEAGIEPEAATPEARTSPFDVLGAALRDATLRGAGTVRAFAGVTADVLVHPAQLPARAHASVNIVRSLGRQGFVADRARSDLTAARSLQRHFETLRVSLPALKQFSGARGGSVNDAYVTALCAALGRYHVRNGSAVTELRLAMPVSTRGRDGRRREPVRTGTSGRADPADR